MNQTKTSGGQLYGVLAIAVLTLSTFFFFIPMLFMGLLKLIPNIRLKVFCTKVIDGIAFCWADVNKAYINVTQHIDWQVSGLENLKRRDWYLLVANHQSWLDIVVLQCVFNRKIPMLKFFIKDSLKWIPLLGFSWWAMGCPFMKRYSKEYLAKKPHKKGKDLEATRKAIEIFKHTPATIINFVEGTRFTHQKQVKQQSPYDHLLKPKAGGISFVMSTLGKKFNNLLDVTIIYPDTRYSLWDFLCHRMAPVIKVCIRPIQIPDEFTTTQLAYDENTQTAFREWLNEQWRKKDELIGRLREEILA
ncbi:acyltransferase [Legionella rubrilucens]|uniref:Acyltransferase n=1 Tax=Legionella rubrilucens TaxID=458 RepID=A0A0W0XW84_9GAMM|nr:acyltransferase [Legionella rubrilucens]KTD48908.1 acyltransferase [Legionella rubrilucens]